MMYNMHFLQLILLLIFNSVNGNMECDCNTISAIQEVMQNEFFQIKLENSKMASRLRRLEASSKQSKTMNHQHLETVSGMSKDLDTSHDKTRNDIKRIETIESTLARIVPQFESYIQNKTDDIKHRIHGQRIDKIESELALVSNKTDNLLDMDDESKNAMVQLQRTIRKAFQGEKIRRLNTELEMNEKIKNIEDLCVNFTGASGQLIDEFKKKVAIENKEFAAKIDQKVININKIINDNKIDVDSSLDDLENEFSKTKKTLSNLEDIISKDRTDTRVFFTASGITEGGHRLAIFPNIIQNYGNGYDNSTGKFTCKYPGIYMFSFQISKVNYKSTELLYCKIYINNAYIIGARGHPSNDEDGYSISVSGTFHLDKNDKVYVAGCHGIRAAFNDYDSSFTGVLIVQDNI